MDKILRSHTGLPCGVVTVIGKEIGKFNSKKEAQEAASLNHGSEIIYQKDNKWQVSSKR